MSQKYQHTCSIKQSNAILHVSDDGTVISVTWIWACRWCSEPSSDCLRKLTLCSKSLMRSEAWNRSHLTVFEEWICPDVWNVIHIHIIRGIHGYKSNRPNRVNRPFWQIDLANWRNSYLVKRDLWLAMAVKYWYMIQIGVLNNDLRFEVLC